MKQSRIKNSVYNAIIMVLSTGVSSILSLVTTKVILKNYGSDFNGVVATANQIVNLLLIVEGGFSLAINVALFEPFINGDIEKISSIMSAAKRVFIKIGFVFLSIGIVLSFIYSFFVKSNLDFLILFSIFAMVIFASAFNLLFTIKYQIMFQVSQKEYTYTGFGLLISLFSNILVIILAFLKVHVILIRLTIMIFSLLNGLMIYILYRRNFGNINLNVKPDYDSIKGTKDILAQKLTSVVYNSAPLLFISTFIDTKLASVYTVYLSIYNIIKMFINAVVASPVNGFGQLLSDKYCDMKDIYKKFKTYEFIVIVITTILISSVLSVILPFVKLYTFGINDINYIDLKIAIMLAIIVILEVIHIPSGNMINVTANFKAAKKIQIITCMVLVILLSIGGYIFGIYGILFATIVTNVLLVFLEIYYAHRNIFNSSIFNFLKVFIINAFLALLICTINYKIVKIDSYFEFFVFGLVILIINIIIVLCINYLFFREQFNYLIQILKKFFLKNNKKEV